MNLCTPSVTVQGGTYILFVDTFSVTFAEMICFSHH